MEHAFWLWLYSYTAIWPYGYMAIGLEDLGTNSQGRRWSGQPLGKGPATKSDEFLDALASLGFMLESDSLTH